MNKLQILFSTCWRPRRAPWQGLYWPRRKTQGERHQGAYSPTICGMFGYRTGWFGGDCYIRNWRIWKSGACEGFTMNLIWTVAITFDLQCRNRSSATFALKCLKKEHIVETQQQEHVFSERNIMMSCRNMFITRYNSVPHRVIATT